MKYKLFSLIFLFLFFGASVVIYAEPAEEILPAAEEQQPAEEDSPIADENHPDEAEPPATDEKQPEEAEPPVTDEKQPEEETPPAEKEEESLFVIDCDAKEDFQELSNVYLYQVPKEEQGAFYDDFTTLQRRAGGEAYAVASVPYMIGAEVEAYYWGGEKIEALTFEISADGETWNEVPAESIEEAVTQTEGKWSKAVYTITEIASGSGFLKIIWPDNPTEWSPVVGKITASLEESKSQEIRFLSETQYAIPRFDKKEYVLTAQIIDQMNLPTDEEVIWQLSEEAKGTAGVSLSPEGILTVTSEAEETEGLLVTAAGAESELHVTVELSLHNALIGDINDDFVLDKTELDYVLEVYKKTSDSPEWKDIRLVDCNGDNVIDVCDIAYIAMNLTEESE